MESWDLYDNNLTNTNKIVFCENEIPEGFYHIALEIWIINKEHQVLLLKNAVDYSKRYPGSWCCVGGNLNSGEKINDAIARILKDKIGLMISLDNTIINSPKKRDPHKYAYITCIIFDFDDIDVSKVKFNDESSTEAKYVSKNEIIKMCNNGEVSYYLIDRINTEVMQYLD